MMTLRLVVHHDDHSGGDQEGVGPADGDALPARAGSSRSLKYSATARATNRMPIQT